MYSSARVPSCLSVLPIWESLIKLASDSVVPVNVCQHSSLGATKHITYRSWSNLYSHYQSAVVCPCQVYTNYTPADIITRLLPCLRFITTRFWIDRIASLINPCSYTRTFACKGAKFKLCKEFLSPPFGRRRKEEAKHESMQGEVRRGLGWLSLWVLINRDNFW